MDAHLQTQLSLAALACSVIALLFSVVAAFPGLKAVLAAVRDGVLWLALLVVLGGIGFIVWQQLPQRRAAATQASPLQTQAAATSH